MTSGREHNEQAAHEARIDRLAQLAARAWPQWRTTIAWSSATSMASVVILSTNCGHKPLLEVYHPRALDALEAALLVLVGETYALQNYGAALRRRELA